MLQHKPVYLDGEPIGCAATKEQAIALLGKPRPAEVAIAEIAIAETSKAFHLVRKASGTMAA